MKKQAAKISLQYNQPYLVTKTQYHRLMTICEGAVAGLECNGKFYIKVLLMQHLAFIKKVACLPGEPLPVLIPYFGK